MLYIIYIFKLWLVNYKMHRNQNIRQAMAEVYDSFLQIKREIMIMINIYPIVKGKNI